MIKIKLYILIFTSCFIPKNAVLAQSSEYQKIKSDINRMEDAVIKDFQFLIPAKGSESMGSTSLLNLRNKIKNAYENQLKNFQEIENGLFHVKNLIDKSRETKKISDSEARKLITNMEYTRRIILNSRKAEVVHTYSVYKNELSRKPTIAYLAKKLSNIKLPGSCEIHNIKHKDDSLTFKIKDQNKKGEKLNQTFTIKASDINLGKLSLKVGNEDFWGENHRAILNFKTTNDDLSVKKFSLYEDKRGEYYHTEFTHQDKSVPFIKLFGYELGIKKITESTICDDNFSDVDSFQDFHQERIIKQYKKNTGEKT